MIKRIQYIMLIGLLCASFTSYTQENKNKDTSAFVTTSLVDDSEYDEENEEPDSSILRNISESKWQKIKEDKSFIYTREKDKNEKKKKKESKKIMPLFDISNIFNSGVFKVLLFLILGIALIAVVYHLFLSGEFSFLNYRKKKTNQTTPSYEQVEEFSDWDKALNEAIKNKDYRVAVRILYLETLQKLNTQGRIIYQQDKTNWDYVMQLKTTSYGTSFKTLTKYFDYIWYGSFTIEHDQYKMIETSFRTFQSEIQ